MLYATTGLRRQEILSLKHEDIDFEKRMITPNNHFGETKESWVSFYDEEAEQAHRGTGIFENAQFRGTYSLAATQFFVPSFGTVVVYKVQWGTGEMMFT
jgi:integrase